MRSAGTDRGVTAASARMPFPRLLKPATGVALCGLIFHWVMRLHFGNDVRSWLSEAFNKTFLRNEERKANGLNGPTIERLIPFWEFIDIEWDAEEEVFIVRVPKNIVSGTTDIRVKSENFR